MNFCGIICEFNPLHNGHEYIIQKAKELSNQDVLCLMSGDFVQRGEAAICDKFERAKSAVLCGASAVLELPTPFACSYAENFAFGAIKILSALEIDKLACGVENVKLETLEKIAELKYQNSIEFVNCFKNELQNEINFNVALKRSIAKELPSENIEQILSSPNNILAVEYLTAIKKLKANISLLPIERVNQKMNCNTKKFLPAKDIRELIYTGKNVETFIPKNAKFTKIFDKSCLKTLKTMQLLKIRQSEPSELANCFDYNEGIEYRIKKLANIARNLDELSELTTSARYRKARVKKLLLYPLLKISKEAEELARQTKPAVKLLAISKLDKTLLKTYNRDKISILASNSDYLHLSPEQKELAELDLNASEIYRTILEEGKNDKKNGTWFI